MDQNIERIRELEDKARRAPTLAEGQALTEEADRLRNGRRAETAAGPTPQPIFRN